MIKFATRAKLNEYLALTPREGTYVVLADETMQKKKATYSYINGELLLENGGWKEYNWLVDVATFAAIATTYTNPIGLDAVKVLADEEHNGQCTWYLHNGTTWIYQGIYFIEGLTFSISEANTRTVDIAPSTDFTIPVQYLVGKGHLFIFIDGEETVKGIDWNEVGTTGNISTKIQFMNTIPKESRILFKRTVANTNDDKVAARMNKDVWVKFMNDAWSELNDAVSNVGFDIVTKSINVDATTAAVVKTVPSNCKVGTRLLYRKTDASTNVVTINIPSGESVTADNLTSLSLTSQFDNWEIQKISSTSWILLSGCETRKTEDRYYRRYHDGKLCQGFFKDFGTLGSTYSNGNLFSFNDNQFTFNFLVPFKDIFYSISKKFFNSPQTNIIDIVRGTTTEQSVSQSNSWVIVVLNNVRITSGRYFVEFEGRWLS